jgi:hypothetical protein
MARSSADLLTPCASPRARREVVRAGYRANLAVWTSVYPAELTTDSQTCTRLGTMSQDPIGFNAGDANLYRYVGNGPTTKIDPTGLWEWGDWIWILSPVGRPDDVVNTYDSYRDTYHSGKINRRGMDHETSALELNDWLDKRLKDEKGIAGKHVLGGLEELKKVAGFCYVANTGRVAGGALRTGRGPFGYPSGRVAPNSVGNSKLGDLIRRVSGKNVSAAEKIRLLEQGAAKIDGITFIRQADVSGAKAIFKGSPIGSGPMKGQSPILAVLEDGRVVKGFDFPHPFGKPYHVIDLSKLK